MTKWYMHNQNPSWKMRHINPSDFEVHTNHIISAKRLDLIIVKKKKEKKGTCRTVNFAVPADHKVKLKESENRDKFMNPAMELKKLWNIKVTVVSIVIGALGTVTKTLIQGLEDLGREGRVETIQATTL